MVTMTISGNNPARTLHALPQTQSTDKPFTAYLCEEGLVTGPACNTTTNPGSAISGSNTAGQTDGAFAQSADNVDFVRTNVFDGQISLEIPEGWGHGIAADGNEIYNNCIASCEDGSQRLVLKNEGSQSGLPIPFDTIQYDKPTSAVLSNGQTYVEHVVHIPFKGKFYLAAFYYLPELQQEFLPIMQRISTSLSDPVTNDNSGAILDPSGIQNGKEEIKYCTNMNIINNMNVNPSGNHIERDQDAGIIK